MSDTTWDECKCCATDGDCINGLCLSCREYGNKPITEHPDVQRLIRQVVDLQILVNDLTADKERLIGQVVELQAENAKLKNDIRIMVEKAADKNLAGYRELGVKLAAMESTNEELQAENAKMKEIIKRFLAIAEALKGGCWE